MPIDSRIIEQFNARAPFKWEDCRLLMLARVGSHSHNTYIPPSDPNAIDDIDYMGVIVPPLTHTLGLLEWESLSFIHEELDCTFYSFRKVVTLLRKGNPNVLGLLYLNPDSYVEIDPIWLDIVVSHRHIFVNKKRTFDSFVGYSRSQLQKMTSFDIQTQNEYDAALAVIEAAGWTKEQVVKSQQRGMPNFEAIRHMVDPANDLADLSLERQNAYLMRQLDDAVSKLKHIHAYHFQGYMGDKRKNLVRKHGYDTKNAAHLIRLMRMCVEYLQTGKLQVYRTTDADNIRDIKRGAFSLEQVQQEAAELFRLAEQEYERSTLPEYPDDEAINHLCVDVHLHAYDLR